MRCRGGWGDRGRRRSRLDGSRRWRRHTRRGGGRRCRRTGLGRRALVSHQDRLAIDDDVPTFSRPGGRNGGRGSRRVRSRGGGVLHQQGHRLEVGGQIRGVGLRARRQHIGGRARRRRRFHPALHRSGRRRPRPFSPDHVQIIHALRVDIPRRHQRVQDSEVRLRDRVQAGPRHRAEDAERPGQALLHGHRNLRVGHQVGFLVGALDFPFELRLGQSLGVDGRNERQTDVPALADARRLDRLDARRHQVGDRNAQQIVLADHVVRRSRDQILRLDVGGLGELVVGLLDSGVEAIDDGHEQGLLLEAADLARVEQAVFRVAEDFTPSAHQGEPHHQARGQRRFR